MQTLVALFLGQFISYLSKILRIGGGSAAPGLYALKLDPDIVSKLTAKIPVNVVITGTNGKTTTMRMLAHFAKESGLKVIRNHTGSNLERGIASTLIAHHQSQADLGIWELDEAAFNTVAPKINPDYVVFLNVFRDQLDRYGEVDIVVKNWCQTLTVLPDKTIVLINGDDANTNKLKQFFQGKVQSFGVKDYKIIGESLEHIKEQENLDFEAKDVKLKGLSDTSFTLHTPYSILHTNLSLPGIYHIYDFLAAFAVGLNLGFSEKKMVSSLDDFQPAFGRFEKINIKNNGCFIFLIKNPAGATQVFETVTPNIKKNDRMLLALNDNLADGTDVSWIWDAQFERLQWTGYSGQIICSGTRGADLAVRLKYTGIDPTKIIVESDLKKALQKAKEGLKGHLFILPTYTAMLELQRILARSGLKKHYWEEE